MPAHSQRRITTLELHELRTDRAVSHKKRNIYFSFTLHIHLKPVPAHRDTVFSLAMHVCDVARAQMHFAQARVVMGDTQLHALLCITVNM